MFVQTSESTRLKINMPSSQMPHVINGNLLIHKFKQCCHEHMYTPCLVHCNYKFRHLHNFSVLLPAHSKAKRFACHLQRVADGVGWLTAQSADVLMGDLKPLLLGIRDLRRGKRPHEQSKHGLIHVTGMFVI